MSSTKRKPSAKKPVLCIIGIGLCVGIITASSAVAHIVDPPPDDPPPQSTLPDLFPVPVPNDIGGGELTPPLTPPVSPGGPSHDGPPSGGSGSMPQPTPNGSLPANGGNQMARDDDKGISGLSYGGDSIPQIDRMPEGTSKLSAMTGALDQMLRAIDPDLRTGSGQHASVGALANFHESKFSDPEAVRAALHVAGRTRHSSAPGDSPSSAGAVPSAAEIALATATLRQAAVELLDDVSSTFAADAFDNPTRRAFWWTVLGLLSLAGVAALVWWRRQQGPARMSGHRPTVATARPR